MPGRPRARRGAATRRTDRCWCPNLTLQWGLDWIAIGGPGVDAIGMRGLTLRRSPFTLPHWSAWGRADSISARPEQPKNGDEADEVKGDMRNSPVGPSEGRGTGASLTPARGDGARSQSALDGAARFAAPDYARFRGNDGLGGGNDGRGRGRRSRRRERRLVGVAMTTEAGGSNTRPDDRHLGACGEPGRSSSPRMRGSSGSSAGKGLDGAARFAAPDYSRMGGNGGSERWE